MTAFDYVIVGAGTAGCVLANRLSADPKVSVCVLEAGPSDRFTLIHNPGALGALFFIKKYDWSFKGKPESRRRRTDEGIGLRIPVSDLKDICRCRAGDRLADH